MEVKVNPLCLCYVVAFNIAVATPLEMSLTKQSDVKASTSNCYRDDAMVDKDDAVNRFVIQDEHKGDPALPCLDAMTRTGIRRVHDR